ncbi:MAG: hypothetical protein ACTSQB_00725 [Candidatus Heimdallarchaeota archaeon]
MNQSEAIIVAEKHARELGYKTSKMDYRVEKYDTHINPWLREDYTDEYCMERKALLKGKVYWAVYFSLKKVNGKGHFGGDICVFIDVITGIIITNVRGK